jgi:hypothetical protein
MEGKALKPLEVDGDGSTEEEDGEGPEEGAGRDSTRDPEEELPADGRAASYDAAPDDR